MELDWELAKVVLSEFYICCDSVYVSGVFFRCLLLSLL